METTIISSGELRQILINPPKEFLRNSDEYLTILIECYTIEDEYIILDKSITIKQRLIFKNCTFNCQNSLWIEGITCENYVTFENCDFTNGVLIQSGIFHKELLFNPVSLKHIHFLGGTFEKVSISGYDIQKIWISNSNFKSFHVGEYIAGDNIKELVIFSKANEKGDLFVNGLSFEKLNIHGIIKDRKFNFSDIKCNSLIISDFTNEGMLNFYGIEPKDKLTQNNYFQIINCNLGKAQFYNSAFSLYKELIIINSFITDCLFVGCNWSNNVRAQYGPGFGNFEESVKNGRKTTLLEFIAIKEAYRQLKISMSKHSDKIQENKFYAQELNFYNKSLEFGKPWENSFWDKIILSFSNWFSDYGQSFIKPLFWLLSVHFLLFFIVLYFNGIETIKLSIFNPTCEGFRLSFEKYFELINPIRSLSSSFTGYLIFVDLLMRVWSSYMIYNIIRATRRFIS